MYHYILFSYINIHFLSILYIFIYIYLFLYYSKFLA
nr:MAG TPA: hypothetical protein [Bacteriophage sp.]